jgi:hypothetical protein
MANPHGMAAAAPTLCRNSCGFFGRPDQRDLCSKCFKDMLKAEAASQGTPLIPEAPNVPPLQRDSNIPAEPLVPETVTAVPAAKKSDRHRCGVCRKKLRLAQQFECMCQDTFCGEHRYADAHDCSFDYVKRHQDRLRKDNPEVVAAKLDKI